MSVLASRDRPVEAGSRRALGWPSENFVAGALVVLLCAFLLVSIALPLWALLSKSFLNAQGEFVGLANYAAYFANPILVDSLFNSVFVAVLSTVIVIPLAFTYAYALTRTCMPGKPFFYALALLPLFAPSLMSALSLVYIFGNQGFLRWLLFGNTIYGPIGIVIAQVTYTFPHAVLILVTALGLSDGRLYEVADALGTSKRRIFWTVTLPGAQYGLVSASFVVFTLVITDFGIPKVIGGQFNVLATDVYRAVVGQQNFEMGAVVGMILLVPAVLAFLVDRIVNRRQVALLSARAVPYQPAPKTGRDVGFAMYCIVVGVLVAAALGVLGLALGEIYARFPLHLAMGEMAWATSNSFLLVAIPFFVLLGEILLRSGSAERMYAALVQWVPWLPGGLMHSNIAACGLFAATSGSSVATAATIGTVAMGEIERRGYNERLFLGTIAAGGTLGILVPPSINMIVYGVLTETSIPALYLAGLVPGIVLASLFSLTVLIVCLVRPELDGERVQTSWEGRWRSLPDLIPPVFIFLAVVGSIYAGLATATEAAALGVLAALVVAAWKRRLTWGVLRESLEGTMRTTAMIMAILIAAYFLNFVITSIGLTARVNRSITELGLGRFELLLVVIGFYIVLGMFMETLSMMVATVPIIVPVLVRAGFDPVWLGVLIVLLMETAMITPPIGINLYVVQGLRKRGRIDDVMVGAAPFVLTLIGMIALLVAWPDIALWLPRTARG